MRSINKTQCILAIKYTAYQLSKMQLHNSLFHHHRLVDMKKLILAYKLQTSVNHPEESTQHSEHGERLKSRMLDAADEAELKHVTQFSPCR
jgi:hypothetical protein